ncbi:hypothetical protein E4U43_006488 [Claviceps pusilla]|uniref:Uncharacterized protein n=1 Tax=Claviceps pusilla TaxID=123648 RepID=A0A9P7SVR4_9HYPO|nr:hypothetical protein E4U43_006488 [Claviceps pusilla]
MDLLSRAAYHCCWVQSVRASPVALVGIVLAVITVAYTVRLGLGPGLSRQKTSAWTTDDTRATHEEASPRGDAAAGVAIVPLHDFDWTAEEPVKYLPVKPVYHITMALQKDTPSDLITIDRDYLHRITLRRRLISQKGSAVHDCLPRGHESVSELYAYLLHDYLPVRYPTMFRLSADASQCENLVTGRRFPLEPPPPLPAAALGALGEMVEEDIFLLHPTPDGHLCVAFVCCFPAGFDPSEKFGKLIKDIHAPVPSYDRIGPSMESFFCKLQVGKSVKRLNVNLSPTPTKCLEWKRRTETKFRVEDEG